MSVRVRVAVALVVAAVVPLLGVFGVVGVLLPNQLADRDAQRLKEAAAAVSVLLTRECEAVGDRAALVASRLLLQVAVADGQVSPGQTVAQQAQRIVDRSLEERWSVVVLDPVGTVLASGGPDAAELAADPASLQDRSCSDGRLGDPAGLTVVLPLENVEQPLGAVVVSAPLDEESLTRLASAVALQEVGLAVVAGEEVAAAGGTAPIGRTDGDAAQVAQHQQRALGQVVDEVRRLRGDATTTAGTVGDQPVAVTGTALRGVAVVAVGRASTSVDRDLALVFVVTALRDRRTGVAAVVHADTSAHRAGEPRPPDRGRGGRARRDRPRRGSDADADVKGVSAVLGSLARDLRASEADAQRRRGAFLDAFSRLRRRAAADPRPGRPAADRAAGGPAGRRGADGPGAAPRPQSSRLSGGSCRCGRAPVTTAPPRAGRPSRAGSCQQVAERALAERDRRRASRHRRARTRSWPCRWAARSRPLGAVVVARDVGAPAYDAVAFEAIGALATNAGTALANIKDHQEVERLSVTDPLTGVNNFRHLSTMLARELERATRFGHPLGVLMLDIDRFKPVNDTHGHAAGDAVLRELARRVKECVREVDTVARYGGEEFALLLPETDLDGAERLAERVLTAIRSEVFRAPRRPLTWPSPPRWGWRATPSTAAPPPTSCGAADDALYRAKAGGRDRVEVAPVGQGSANGRAATAGAPRRSPERDTSP